MPKNEVFVMIIKSINCLVKTYFVIFKWLSELKTVWYSAKHTGRIHPWDRSPLGLPFLALFLLDCAASILGISCQAGWLVQLAKTLSPNHHLRDFLSSSDSWEYFSLIFVPIYPRYGTTWSGDDYGRSASAED